MLAASVDDVERVDHAAGEFVVGEQRCLRVTRTGISNLSDETVDLNREG